MRENERKKFIVVVIDSFGVGAMPDVPQVRPQDIGANTCLHILQQLPQLQLPTLAELGLMNVLGQSHNGMPLSQTAIYGSALLQHEGGDTFIGHQEIMGTLPQSPLVMPFAHVIDQVQTALQDAGFNVARVSQNGLSVLWVNDHIAIGDNLEADLGQVYNVTANLNAVSFEQVCRIGQIVRRHVKVGRVIAFGGRTSDDNILAAIEVRQSQFIGVNAPKSGAYADGFQVVHLGYGVDAATQAPQLLQQQGIATVLIGKVADIVANPHGINYQKRVDSQHILQLTLQHVHDPHPLFICSNIQETDLAGHAQDVVRYADRLQIVDQGLAAIIAAMQPQDCLLVLADHGNDPTIGHSKHTREKVPLLVYRKNRTLTALGERTTLSDVGATVCDFFAAKAPQNGTSFLHLIYPE
ncbi:phosphopentomutase [Pasteurella testudinis DSM 23072]|uniref:Phosphopentomutase n=1 Tax=Pasteurella testudinis DSM 23072 TaxID=1122938 RepID=A0A1W1UGH2_9PAST|nr:phosphopentomutase [Pasteurella testudinis]SMB80139.1 phosphopentomutase [Pasteurella testudinis DSM 23072]SUB50590.1 putative mutase [Pasteurella testudinis]